MGDPITAYVVRHGETEYNRRRLMQGQRIDAPLNRTGMAQAAALAERFRGVALDAVYASPLRRAVDTARSVLRHHHGLPLRTLDALAEMSWGDLEGRSIDDVGDVLRKFQRQWRDGHFHDRVGGGESILEVEMRARQALEHFADRHAGETVLAVTHGRFLRVLLATAIPSEEGLRRMDRFGHANTGVYRITLGRGGARLDMQNCTDHLESVEDAA